jgi:PPK2 family polyphosphate:nucleotide phosphotransferase
VGKKRKQSVKEAKELGQEAKALVERFRVTDGRKFRLKDWAPDDLAGFTAEDKPRAKQALASGIALLADLQDKLYAQDQWGLLLIFQAMDAAGKDGAIKHVMSGVNPQGCQVFSFKMPSIEDLDHDYMWRCMRCFPERGRIGIFNRSYYEETLVVRVHREYLASQRIPKPLVTRDIWADRFEDINGIERYLGRNGIVVRKFFLNVSREEQKRRLLERVDNPEKNWKISSADSRERGLWAGYMEAYEDMIRHTSTPEAPWYVVPADNKWFSRAVVAAVVIDALASMNLHYPKVGKAKRKELELAKQMLLNEK